MRTFWKFFGFEILMVLIAERSALKVFFAIHLGLNVRKLEGK